MARANCRRSRGTSSLSIRCAARAPVSAARAPSCPGPPREEPGRLAGLLRRGAARMRGGRGRGGARGGARLEILLVSP
jgi:hypothetical protein